MKRLLPPNFFDFDIKDTARLVVWVIISAFTCGMFWQQRKTDLSELAAKDAAQVESLGREEKARVELAREVNDVARAVQRRQEIDAAQVQALEGIHTELRYVNDKIDVLRDEVRGSHITSTPRRPN